jgi:hypothetical protein
MVYRVGTDLAKALHSSILHSKSKIDKLEESNQALNIMMFPVKSIFFNNFSSSSLAVILNKKVHKTG